MSCNACKTLNIYISNISKSTFLKKWHSELESVMTYWGSAWLEWSAAAVYQVATQQKYSHWSDHLITWYSGLKVWQASW